MYDRTGMPVDAHKLGFVERALSVVLGLGIAAAGAKPRPNPILNVVALAAGSYLAWRGATGHDPLGIEVMDQDDRA